MNIIPDSVEMLGTIRTFDPAVRDGVIERMRSVAEHVATANGATATLEILPGSTPVLVNTPDLTLRALPAMERAVGKENVVEIPYVTGAEDYAYFALEVPSVYFFVGSTPVGQDPATAPANHSPLYFVAESSLDVGLRTLLTVAVDYLENPPR
jgi:amidohydrolase